MRKAKVLRKTNEVNIKVLLNLDGNGRFKINTGFEPLNHLLELLSFHSFFDLEIEAKGDLAHHIIEDIGIAFGKAFKEALGDKKGISRYGCFSVVMDKTVVEVDVDISGRPNFSFIILAPTKKEIENKLAKSRFDNTNFAFNEVEEFLKAFTQQAGISLACIVKDSQDDLHHILEALFKALAKALDIAIRLDPRRKGIPSTKGIID
ncbi:MAG: imidazoleglycerol-phosphate dehydratase [Candidatus Omnitrophica bacterium]|nr:imidazoleglycerol-phosphate dehydratase [Candidatus Omnitrophota bacterium]MCM8831713.1 imidazoleglycerol-phosphate dehydratase [Candidatus Omnitrophota bacterium]